MDQARKTQFIIKKDESSILKVKEYKKTCKICKEADEYLLMKSQKNTSKKFLFST